MPRWGEHALAAFVAVHLLLIGITGIGDAPTRESRSDRATLKHLAFDNDAIEDRIVASSERWNRFRGSVVRATKPYARCCGTYQMWRMFAGTHRHASRIELAVRIDGDWQTVWAEGADADPVIDYYRFRHYRRRLKGKKKDRRWSTFATRAAERTLAEHPDADEVRVRVMLATIPRPGESADLVFDDEIKTTVVER
ncbi:MAG: hypothetical protein GY898_20255 [Proteobacteria bacterium]|nr:hypothetical protein [Pseudomonadota bacterium]